MKLVTIEFLNGMSASCLVSELNEGKTPWTTGISIYWQRYFYHLTSFGEEAFDLALQGVIAHITDINPVADDYLL